MRYADADRTIIDAGDGRFIPADPENSDFVAIDPKDIAPFVAPAARPLLLSKVTILDRLNAAGLLAKAFTAMGGPGSYVYERWQAASEMIDTTNPLVTQVLDAIQADKTIILAPETSP